MDNSSIGGSWKGYNPPPAAAAASGVDAAGESNGVSVLPPEILSQVFTLLGNDIQSAALVSRSWNAIAIDNIKRKEMELLQTYSKFLADNLDGEEHLLEKKELLRLSEDTHILNCDSLSEMRIFLLEVRGNIESQLSKLDQNDFNKLRELTKNIVMPGLLKVIFDYVDVVNSLNEANLMQNPFPKSLALQNICKRLVELGEFDRALEVAHAIPLIGAGSYSDSILADICREFVERGHFEKAIEIARSITHNWKVFEEICWSLTQANKVDRAMEVASNLDTENLRSYAFRGICLSLNSSLQFDRAIAVANRIEEDDLRGGILQRISNDLLSSGKLEESKRLAMTIPTVYCRSCALEKICMVLGEQERIDELIEVAGLIPDAFIRDSLLWQAQQISEAMFIRRIKLTPHLVACIEHAKEVANNIPDRRLEMEAFANICHILLAKYINEAKNIAASIIDEGIRQYMYGLISFHLFSKAILMTAADVTNLIFILNETDDYKAMVLALIVNRLVKLNRKEDAIILIDSIPEGRIKNRVQYMLDSDWNFSW